MCSGKKTDTSQLPPIPGPIKSYILSEREVRRVIGNVSHATLWRMRQREGFPEPVQISAGRVGWLSTAVEEWIAAKAAARRK